MIDEEFKKQIARNPQLNYIVQNIRKQLTDKGFDKKQGLSQTLSLLAANEVTLREFLADSKHCLAGPMSTCQQTNIGFEKQISYHNGKFYLDLIHCNHWKLAHRQELRQKYLVYSDYNLNDLPENFEEALKLLADYQLSITAFANQRRELFLIQAWQMLDQQKTRGFYLFGPSDYGKTFLFRLLVNCWATQEKTQIALVKVPKFINDCRNLLQKKAIEKQQKLIAKLKRVDVLFLDELGAETISRWSRDELLFDILNYRCDQEKLTFINSNFSWSQLTQHYIVTKENQTIEKIKVNRFLSRLKRLTQEWKLSGGKL